MGAETGYLVTYNGQAPWGTGVSGAVPFVSVDIEEVWQAGRIGMVRTISLNGTIPSGGTSQISAIQSLFATNFKPFVAPNIVSSGASVQEVSFNSQNYIGKVDYTVVLKDYSGFLLTVNNPVEEVSFQTQQDGSVIINHRISAEGVSASGDASTAFDAAKSFVTGRTGLSTINSITTSFVNSGNRSNIYAVSQQENINRVAGTYGVTEVFRYDPLRNVTNGTCKRFSVDFNSGINEDYIQVSVNGTYQVGKDAFDSGLFAQVTQAELFALANVAYGNLNPLPVSFSVEGDSVNETLWTRNVNARAVFDNSPGSSFFDYDFEVAKSFRDGISQISIRGQIIGSGRHVRRRFDSALSFYNSTIGGYAGAKGFIYNAAISGINALGAGTYSINPQPKAFSINFNSGQGIISINATFDDSPFVSGYTDFLWAVADDCGLNVFRPHPSANQNGSYLIQDLGIINRSAVTVNGNFTFVASGSGVTDHASVRAVLINIEGGQNIFTESETYNLSSGDSIRTGFSVNYTKQGCGLTLPSDGKIYAGTRI